MNVKRKPAKAERPTSKMRALFREAARDIVARDREARKGGRTQNTIGEIERAMVKAYVCGQEALLNRREGLPPSANALVDWLEIPPRARETLSFMTICFSHRWSTVWGEASASTRIPSEIELFIENGRKRWTIVNGETRSERSIADGSVAPLVRLGLLAASSDYADRYVLTASGIAAGDPTLPREGMR